MTQKMIDLRQRFIDRPLFICENTARLLSSAGIESFKIEDYEAEAAEALFNYNFSGRVENKPYKMVGNVAVIPINGTLLHKVNWGGSWYTGYTYIRNLFDIAMEDQDVAGIVLEVNSGGGEVSGAFPLAEHIRSSRSKPTMTIVDEHAYSAAYLLGSATQKMSVPKTGGVGSIGVVTMHIDYSKALDDMGVKVTYIHAGKHKVDGNPYEPLPKAVRGRIQARVDQSYDLFVEAVHLQRGLSTEDVKATEAQTFGAEEALNLGLVDVIASPEEALASFMADLNGKKHKGTLMSTQSQKATQAGQQAGEDAQVTFTQADIDAAKAEGMKAGREEERARFSAVMSSEHFAANMNMAKKMLANANLSADEINDMLSEAPKVDQASSAANAFEQAMVTTGNPEVGANKGDDQEEPGENRMLRNYGLATGKKLIQ